MVETSVKLGFVVFIMVTLLGSGTFIYSYLEGWSLVDGFYFTAVTLTTIGYGDLVPTTDLSKIVTVVFALSGVAIFLYALSIIAYAYIKTGIERGQQFEQAELQKIRSVLSKISSPFKKRPGLPR